MNLNFKMLIRLAGKKLKTLRLQFTVGVISGLLLAACLPLMTVQATTSNWSKPRPTQHRDFNDLLGNAYSDGEGVVDLGVAVAQYNENDGGHGGEDYVTLNVTTSADTRKGIGSRYSQNSPFWGYQWLEVSTPTGLTGDDAGVWLQLGFTFLYFGIQYTRIWVCSNGFVSLTNESTAATPQAIPNGNWANAIVAPFWRDLKPNQGGSIKYGTAIFSGDDSQTYFVVTWDNVPDAGGHLQKFQLLIQNRNGFGSSVFENKIWFQYFSVTKDRPTTIGVQDRLGRQGSSISLSQISNNYCTGFFPYDEGSRLISLKIKLTKSDSQAHVIALGQAGGSYMCGYNVELQSTENPWGDFWAGCITTAANVALDACGAGEVIDGAFVLYDILSSAASAAYSNSVTNDRYHSSTTSENDAWTLAYCHAEQPGGGQEAQGEPFDASFASCFEWCLTDPDNARVNHALTITTEAFYENFATLQCNTISTSVTLQLYTGFHYVDIHTLLPGGAEQTNVKIWVNGVEKRSPVISLPVADGTVSIQAESPIVYGWYGFDKWSDNNLENPRTFPLHSDWSKDVLYKDIGGGGGGGGCPYVSTWNGTGYVLDNNLLPTSKLGHGSDVEDYYVLEKPLVENNGWYSLIISEFENEHDYLDQIKLIAVDHDSDVKIAATPDGKILTYKNPASPISCVDSNGMDRLSQIHYIDGNFSDPSTYFQGNKNDYMLLNFGKVTPGPAKLIVRNDMLCADKCILVQVKNATGEWDTIAIIASRATWATEGVDLSPYVVRGEDLVVRLFWTQPHKLDFVGLDTSRQKDYEIHYATLVSATHSVQGNVRTLISKNDGIRAELIPGQQIALQFKLADNEEQARTFILYVEGHYDSITP